MKIKSLIKSNSLNAEVIITFVLLLYYIGAFSIKTPIGNINNFDYSSQKSLIEKIIAPLSYILVPFLISRKWKLCIYLTAKNISLFCFLVLVNLSIIWASTDVGSNIPNVRGLLLSTTFGIYLAARFSIKEQARLLAGAFLAVILFSIAVALFVPGYGVHSGIGNLEGWTGIFEHKNTLGAYMAWSASVFLSLSLSIRNNFARLVLWLGFALSLLLVFLAGSAGGILNLLCVISIVPLSRFFKQTYYKLQVVLIVSATLLIGSVFFFIAANLQAIAELLGKNLTFSGRIPMWLELSDYIAEKPLLGYGFNGFWETEYGQIFRSRWQWEEVPHSHNGFIELILALGLIGLSIFAIGFIFTSLEAYKQAYTAKTLEDILPLQFVLTFLIANLSESRLLISNNMYWIFYVTISMSLTLEYVRKRKLKQLDRPITITEEYDRNTVEVK